MYTCIVEYYKIEVLHIKCSYIYEFTRAYNRQNIIFLYIIDSTVFNYTYSC